MHKSFELCGIRVLLKAGMRGIISRGTCKLTLLQAAKLLSTMKVKWKVVVFHSIVSRTLIVYHWLIETESIEECVVISKVPVKTTRCLGATATWSHLLTSSGCA